MAATSWAPRSPRFERELAEFCGAKHVLSCANGTDALGLALMALGLERGEAVLVPSFTFAATAEVVAWYGAVPVFVDVFADTFNMDPASLEAGIATARRQGLRPVGVIPVDLFGLPAAYDEILDIAKAHRLWVLCDAAQSFGAVYRGRSIGTIGDISTTSFFRPSPWAAMATAAPSSPGMTRRRACLKACGCMARAATNTTMCGLA